MSGHVLLEYKHGQTVQACSECICMSAHACQSECVLSEKAGQTGTEQPAKYSTYAGDACDTYRQAQTFC